MWLPEKYQRAIKFAAERHGDQTVPGTNFSYIVHLSNVCMEIFLAAAHSEDFDVNLAMQCAILHDTIEDTNTTYDEIKEHFGQKVADGVKALTKNAELEKKMQMRESLLRIKQQPKEIWMVKIADRITNLQEPPHYWNKEKINHYELKARSIKTAG